MNGSNDSDEDNFNRMLAVFGEVMIKAELDVLRERVLSLLEKENQQAGGVPSPELRANLQAQIFHEAAQKANVRFAGLADRFPDGATAFSGLLERWKKAHQI